MMDALAANVALNRPARTAAPSEPRSLASRDMLWMIALVGLLLTLTSGLNAWLSYRQVSEAAAQLELVVNLAAAARLGVAVPQCVAAPADRVIE